MDDMMGGGEQIESPEAIQTPEIPVFDAAKTFRSRVDACKRIKRLLIEDWATNVDYRRGKPYETDSDFDRVTVNLDWSATKAKQAQLFSQVPQAILTPKHPAFAKAVPVFAKVLNDTLERAGVGAAMDEVLPDVINAAGVGGILVAYEAITVPKAVPLDPAMPEVTETVPVPVDRRFTTDRVSPKDLLWPVGFTGSDFNKAPWVGRSGKMPWAEAKRKFNLAEEERDKIVGASRLGHLDALQRDDDITRETVEDDDMVGFDEIFYWRHLFEDAVPGFDAIGHVVFVNGKTEPVQNGPWEGQRYDDTRGAYLGACKFPIQILTLTYISDDTIPPSDSAIGRPQVNELIRSRSQIVMQRDSSRPMRWHDVNRIGIETQEALMRGTWQGSIPVQGDGSRAIGEVARASYPSEDYRFDAIAKADHREAWQVGANQMGSSDTGDQSASEAQIVQQNFQTRIGYERARVVRFFINIAEVMAGLLALYGDFEVPEVGEDGLTRLAGWDRSVINGVFVYKVRADASVLLDSEQRIRRLVRFLDMTGKSGYIDAQPVITEIAELSGLDPETVVKPPAPPKPDQPNISLRIAGEDLMNPMVVAMLIKSEQMPTPEELEAAKKLLMEAMSPDKTGMMPSMVEGGGMSTASTDAPDMSMPDAPLDSAPEPVMDAQPDWTMMSKINKRRDAGDV